jgi:hypothetical protein
MSVSLPGAPSQLGANRQVLQPWDGGAGSGQIFFKGGGFGGEGVNAGRGVRGVLSEGQLQPAAEGKALPVPRPRAGIDRLLSGPAQGCQLSPGGARGGGGMGAPWGACGGGVPPALPRLCSPRYKSSFSVFSVGLKIFGKFRPKG